MHGAGGMHGKGRACTAKGGRGTCVAKGCVYGRGACMTGETATAEDGTNPTGMHSCA